jgi:hypothetical protein
MGLDVVFFIIFLLFLFAFLDLVVGVSNDAVNFLNASIGSKVAPRYIIMSIASLGIFMGVTFSSGMMEIARRGVFHPQYFTMPDLLVLFLGVMMADIILLDLFNTFGLPTSTTVSVVFELLGGAVAVSIWKIKQQGDSLVLLGQYINTSRAMTMIFGILLSIVVAFVCGTFFQFLSRLVFTFDYRSRIKSFGAVWGGIALSSITYFILIKGAAGAVFITPEKLEWIQTHTWTMLMVLFIVSAVFLQILIYLKLNIFKLIVLTGTFAIAMAFAANDLVNFIGVPLAGLHAWQYASVASDPMTATMEQLSLPVRSEWYILLIAGAVMVVTLWVSRKARTVSRTEISLSSQFESYEQSESILLARTIVKMFISLYSAMRKMFPQSLVRNVSLRFHSVGSETNQDHDKQSSFDLLRASVNLMVASAVISYATSHKLPLSTTYVTFMVAMGSSFADRAWGRESAVYRITGVLTVIGGWFMTALLASTLSFTFASIMFNFEIYGVIGLLLLASAILWNNHIRHTKKESAYQENQVFNLKHIKHVDEAVPTTFIQMSFLLREIRQSLKIVLDALFTERELVLNTERRNVRKFQTWSNIITANIFKALRLLQKEQALNSCFYGQTVRCLQKLTDGHRDIVARAYKHVSNQHKGLLDVQKTELSNIEELINDLLHRVETAFSKTDDITYRELFKRNSELNQLASELNERQIERIRSGESKTRLSILYFAILGNIQMIGKQNLRLLEIFNRSFEQLKPAEDDNPE